MFNNNVLCVILDYLLKNTFFKIAPAFETKGKNYFLMFSNSAQI